MAIYSVPAGRDRRHNVTLPATGTASGYTWGKAGSVMHDHPGSQGQRLLRMVILYEKVLKNCASRKETGFFYMTIVTFFVQPFDKYIRGW